MEIGIVGASGKFGRSIVKAMMRDPAFCLVGGVGSPGSKARGEDLGIPLLDNYEALFEKASIIIDVSTASNLDNILAHGLRSGKRLVIGTTGHSQEKIGLVEKAAQEIPIFMAPNFSLGIAAVREVSLSLARLLGEGYALKIEEAHHVHKKDSPSGTALHLAKALSNVYGREIPISSRREGEIIGEHELIFSSPEEEITLMHRAESRDLFAKGVVLAVKFLARQSAGLYSMKELIQKIYETRKD